MLLSYVKQRNWNSKISIQVYHFPLIFIPKHQDQFFTSLVKLTSIVKILQKDLTKYSYRFTHSENSFYVWDRIKATFHRIFKCVFHYSVYHIPILLIWNSVLLTLDLGFRTMGISRINTDYFCHYFFSISCWTDIP